jgi:aminopeptidase
MMVLSPIFLVTPPKGLIMTDSRILKLADVLVHYSLELKPDQQLILRTNPLADELALAVYAEALKAGVHVFPQISLPNSEEIFFKYASEKQLDFISPVRKLIVESFDAQLVIGAEYNTRALTGINPARISRSRKASAPLSKIFLERAARMELRWCYTEFPTQASAQEADMSLMDYQEFVFDAGLLNEPDPVAAWINEGKRQRDLINWLSGKNHVVIRGDIDSEH